MINTAQIVIETPRLSLEAISPAYVQEIFEELNDEVTHYMYPKPADHVEQTQAFVQTSIEGNEAGTNFQTVILAKDTKEFLGCAALHNIHTPTPEFGIWLKVAAQGKGYGKEAIIALKEWADAHLAYEVLLYPVDRSNVASQKIPTYFDATIGRTYEEENMRGKMLHIIEYHIAKKQHS